MVSPQFERSNDVTTKALHYRLNFISPNTRRSFAQIIQPHLFRCYDGLTTFDVAHDAIRIENLCRPKSLLIKKLYKMNVTFASTALTQAHTHSHIVFHTEPKLNAYSMRCRVNPGHRHSFIKRHRVTLGSAKQCPYDFAVKARR